jgi:S1-C subfamily serine protease
VVATRKLIVPALVGVALLIALAGWAVARGVPGHGTPTASRAAAAPAALLTAEQVYQRYGQGVVEVIGASAAGAGGTGGTRAIDNGTGARGLGFAVSRALILTSARLVDHRGSIDKTATVIFRAGGAQTRRVVGAIVCVDATLDLAVIRVDPARATGLVALPMGDSSALRAGQSLTALGDPLAASPTLAGFTVSAPRRALRATSGAALQAVVLAGGTLAGGQSGAPLFDASGRVLAVVDVVGPEAGEPGSVGSAVPINDAAHVIADSLAN